MDGFQERDPEGRSQSHIKNVCHFTLCKTAKWQNHSDKKQISGCHRGYEWESEWL